MRLLRLLLDWSPASFSSLVPGMVWFGGGNVVSSAKAPPPVAPAPARAMTPTQSVTDILSQRAKPKTVLASPLSSYYNNPMAKKTILGVPIA